jgi:hypothetical protein
MLGTLAAEIQRTILSLGSSLEALRQFQQAHTKDGTVCIPLCMTSWKVDIECQLHRTYNMIDRLPESLSNTTTHFDDIANYVVFIPHSCNPNARFFLVQTAAGLKLRHGLTRGMFKGEQLGTDFRRAEREGVFSNVDWKVSRCIECKGPCQNDGDTVDTMDEREVEGKEMRRANTKQRKKTAGMERFNGWAQIWEVNRQRSRMLVLASPIPCACHLSLSCQSR